MHSLSHKSVGLIQICGLEPAAFTTFSSQGQETNNLLIMANAFYDFLAEGDVLNVAKPTDPLLWEQFDPSLATLDPDSVKGNLAVVTESVNYEHIDLHTTQDMTMDLSRQLTAVYKCKELYTETIGTSWTTYDLSTFEVKFVREPEPAFLPVEYMTEFQPLRGGDSAGSKSNARQNLLEMFCIGAINVPTGLLGAINTLTNSNLQIDALLMRAASLFLSIRCRGYIGGKAIQVDRVNPPRWLAVNNPLALYSFYQEAVDGVPCMMMNADRPNPDKRALQLVMDVLFSERILFPGTPDQIADKFWPPITGPGISAAIAHLGQDRVAQPGQLVLSDVTCAIEALLGDLNQPIDAFDRYVRELAVLSVRPTGDFPMGAFESITLRVAIPQFGPLCCLPMLQKPSATTTITSTVCKDNQLPLLYNACIHADVIARAWKIAWHYKHTLNRHYFPQFVGQLNCLLTHNGCHQLWAIAANIMHSMGPTGAIGRLIGTSVVVPHEPSLSNIFNTSFGIKKLPYGDIRAVLMKPPALATDCDAKTIAQMLTYVEHLMDGGAPMKFTAQLFRTTPDGVLTTEPLYQHHLGYGVDKLADHYYKWRFNMVDPISDHYFKKSRYIDPDTKWFWEHPRAYEADFKPGLAKSTLPPFSTTETSLLVSNSFGKFVPYVAPTTIFVASATQNPGMAAASPLPGANQPSAPTSTATAHVPYQAPNVAATTPAATPAPAPAPAKPYASAQRFAAAATASTPAAEPTTSTESVAPQTSAYEAMWLALARDLAPAPKAAPISAAASPKAPPAPQPVPSVPTTASQAAQVPSTVASTVPAKGATLQQSSWTKPLVTFKDGGEPPKSTSMEEGDSKPAAKKEPTNRVDPSPALPATPTGVDVQAQVSVRRQALEDALLEDLESEDDQAIIDETEPTLMGPNLPFIYSEKQGNDEASSLNPVKEKEPPHSWVSTATQPMERVAEGLHMRLSNIPIEKCREIAKGFKPKARMTVCLALSQTGDVSEQTINAANEIFDQGLTQPPHSLEAMRIEMRNYLKSRKLNYFHWPIAEQMRFDEMRKRIETTSERYRKNKYELSSSLLDIAVQKGPYAELKDVLTPHRQEPGWEYAQANGGYMSGARYIKIPTTSWPHRPLWDTPAQAARTVSFGHITLSTEAPPTDRQVLWNLAHGHFGPIKVLSQRLSPGAVFHVVPEDGSVKYQFVTSEKNGERLAKGILDARVSVIATPDMDEKCLSHIYRAAHVHSGSIRYYIHVLDDAFTKLRVKLENIDKAVTTTTEAAVRAQLQNLRITGANTSPPVSSAPDGAAPEGKAVNEALVSSVSAELKEFLEDASSSGDANPRELLLNACLAFKLMDIAQTRATYVELCEYGVAAANMYAGLRAWKPGGNTTLSGLLDSTKHSAAYEIPSLYTGDLDDLVHVQHPTSYEDDECYTWRPSFFARHGRLHKIRKANVFRAMLDDESAAVKLASRLVAPTHSGTPMDVVRATIRNSYRGCCDGICYCDEDVPLVRDLSSRDETAMVPYTEVAPAACRRNMPSEGRLWVKLCVAKDTSFPTNPMTELALTPSAVRVESLQAWCTAVNLEPINFDDYEEQQEDIKLGGLPITNTLAMARAACRGYSHWEPKCNAAEQIKCGIVLWSAGLSPDVDAELKAYGIHELPAKAVLEWESEVGTIVQRSAMVGRLKNDAWLQLRRMGAVFARNNLRADYEEDLLDRTIRPVVKVCLAVDWAARFAIHARLIAEQAVAAVTRRSDYETFDQHWAKRAVKSTGGSTSINRLVKHMGRTGEMTRDSDRPNKKAGLSSVPKEWVDNVFGAIPINFARASTKPEPRNKARVLNANGDAHTCISSHGIAGFEGSGNVGGMLASQTPEAVGKWLRGVAETPGMLVSADLDNQNWQHELWELAEIWGARERAHARLNTVASLSKARSCAWVRNAFTRSIVKVEGKLHRVFSTLYSGSRGTMLDNTTHHEISRRVCLDDMAAMGMHVLHENEAETGDDESLKTASWTDAVLYIGVTRLQGVRMNAAKQQVGEKHGTFLQRGISRDAVPRQPLAGILSTLCTGNWYRPSGVWLNSVFQGLCENWIEASARGLPLTAAARMCGMQLDQVMCFWQDGERRELEWRKFVNSFDSGNQLFGSCGSGYGKATLPDLVVRIKPRDNWESHGVSDYYATPEAAWIQRACGKAWMVDQFREGIQNDAHSSVEAAFRRDETGRIVAKNWPLRMAYEHVPIVVPELAPAPGLKLTATLLGHSMRAGRAWTEADNLARMGLGAREATLLGGYDALVATAPPEILSKLEPLVEPCVQVVRTAVDSTLLSLVKRFNLPHKEFGMSTRCKPARHIAIVAATHGSAISRIARRMGSKAMRFDRAAAFYVGQEAYDRRGNTIDNHITVFRRAVAVLAEHLSAGAYPNLRCLLTHEHPDVIEEILKRFGLSAHTILYTPDRVEVAKRIAARNVSASLLKYMQSTWHELYQLRGYVDIINDEEKLIQVAAEPMGTQVY